MSWARMRRFTAVLAAAVLAGPAVGQIAVQGKLVYPVAGPPIQDGVVLIQDRKIAAIGPAAQITIPPGARVLQAAVVTPGLIDAHSTVGFSGIYNQPHDSDQLEHSTPIQPELRAIDAINILEPLVAYVRSFGVTTIHTGHAPGELISGQTVIVKTAGRTIGDAVIREVGAVAATLGGAARKGEGKSPGTRAKMVAMLREQLIKAQEYARKRDSAPDDKKPDRDLRLEMLARVLKGELPLMVTANRAQDIANTLRLAQEFNLRLWLDGACEAYLLIDDIKAAGVPVLIHPTMQRAFGEAENMSFETAGKLKAAGVSIVFQAGYEDYVPKTRIVLFEAAWAAANGLGREAALAACTLESAKILGIADRVGSLEVGKDADLALYDGDPFEYTTHCVGVLIDGVIVSDRPR